MRPSLEKVVFIIFCYLILSFFMWFIRLGTNADCEHRYMDYVFPITKLHCKVNP